MEINHKPQTVRGPFGDGVRVQVRETVWADHGRSFSVFRLPEKGRGRILLPPQDTFDHHPTEDELRQLLAKPRLRRGDWTVQQQVTNLLGPQLGLREQRAIVAIVGELEARLAEVGADLAVPQA